MQHGSQEFILQTEGIWAVSNSNASPSLVLSTQELGKSSVAWILAFREYLFYFLF